VVISEVLHAVPGDYFVVAWGNARDREVPRLIRRCGLVEVGAIAPAVRNQDGFNTRHEVLFFIDDGSIDSPAVGAEQNFQRSRYVAAKMQRRYRRFALDRRRVYSQDRSGK